MNKERKICGVKVFVSGETYNEYKGTLEEQLEEKDKEIKWLTGGRQQGKTYQLIKEQQKEIERLHSILQEIKCLIHKAINERELNGVGKLDLSRIVSLLDKEEGE